MCQERYVLVMLSTNSMYLAERVAQLGSMLTVNQAVGKGSYQLQIFSSMQKFLGESAQLQLLICSDSSSGGCHSGTCTKRLWHQLQLECLWALQANVLLNVCTLNVFIKLQQGQRPVLACRELIKYLPVLDCIGYAFSL